LTQRLSAIRLRPYGSMTQNRRRRSPTCFIESCNECAKRAKKREVSSTPLLRNVFLQGSYPRWIARESARLVFSSMSNCHQGESLRLARAKTANFKCREAKCRWDKSKIGEVSSTLLALESWNRPHWPLQERAPRKGRSGSGVFL